MPNASEVLGAARTRRVLLSLLVIGIGLSGFGTATYAFYEDADSSSENPVQMGALDGAIDGSDSRTGSLSLTDAKPTDTVTKNFSLTNQGTAAADHLQVNLSVAENDSYSEPTDPDLKHELTATETASNITVTKLTYTNASGATIDVLTAVNDTNSNGLTDLVDVQNSTHLDDLEPPSTDGTATYLEITLEVPSDGATSGDAADWIHADEPLMADGVDLTFQFSLMQDASQD